ncbi:DMT family transporter [Bradyrhizobium sediminis]|uniref:DMT family transporter n=1 Tax=Bradyrhizobium sediminis TaxID=2840469 RepID=A0A975RS58_9BRAD|nr:DMT family transporter [Bradyrhizobium sediminis]QWG18627.1 DMT family transporter [Bradyrhizobium sediminis]
MTAAILFAFASAAFLGAGVVTSQLGLRTMEPLAGAAVSVPAFTLLFLVLSPILLAGEPVVWRGLPISAAIGLFFPARLTLLAFASNRALGPVITSTLSNLAPLFSVSLAVVLLHEPLRAVQLAGLMIAVMAPSSSASPGRVTSDTGEAGRYCCRWPPRWSAASYRRSSSSGSKCGRARSGPA